MQAYNYYDPLYGRIELPALVVEMINRNEELIRLRSIGMMNFRSKSMLALSSITRLEHSVGITHLVNVFSRKNRSVAAHLSDFLTAALYHDISCASFGHSVEWAIDRHDNYDHETVGDWVASDDALSSVEDKPIYLAQDGLHRYGFPDRYKLDLDLINQIKSGAHTCVINSSGIDLDNIDNVSRMALYLGMLDDRNFPVRLVASMRLHTDQQHFVVDDTGFELVEEWLRTRSAVYREFIYSKEYMGFEYLIFQLVRLYSERYGAHNVRNLFHYTDEILLFRHSISEMHGEAIASVAKKLMLQKVPECYAILRSSSFDRFQDASSPQFCDELAAAIINKSEYDKILSSDERRSISIHVTTDKNKTERAVTIMHERGLGEVSKKIIGKDNQYILFAVLGKNILSPNKVESITRLAIQLLEQRGIKAEHAMFSGLPSESQIALF